MPLEAAVHIKDLVVTNPANSDGLNQADDHMRMIKGTLLTDIGDAMTSKMLTTPDGTSSAPAHGFLADATTGFYRAGTGQTGIVGSLIGQGTVDIGFLCIYAGASAPTGYLACDGQAVSRVTYAALFAKIGTTWGVGDGSTTFNVPGLNSRFPRHREVAGAAGAVGTLQGDQNKSHTHAVSFVSGVENQTITHNFSGTTAGMNQNNPHSHTLNNGNNIYEGGTGSGVGGGGAFGVLSNTVSIAATDINHGHAFSGTTAGQNANHTHNIVGTTATGSADGTEARPLAASLLFCIRAL